MRDEAIAAVGLASVLVIASLLIALVRRRRRGWPTSTALLPCVDEPATAPRQLPASVVLLSAEQSLRLAASGSSWPAQALAARLRGCGGVAFADSAISPTCLCHASGGRLAFARLSSSAAGVTGADVAVCAAAIAADAAAGPARRYLPPTYLQAAFVAPVSEALAPGSSLVTGNPMGMFVQGDPCGGSSAEAPPLPGECALRRLEATDAPRINAASGAGPNRMVAAGLGCWGVEERASGELLGWLVRGADGALGMLHVDAAHRRRGLATAIVHAASTELRAAGELCFAYVRDDNRASRAVFGKLGYARVGDVRWCMVRFA